MRGGWLEEKPAMSYSRASTGLHEEESYEAHGRRDVGGDRANDAADIVGDRAGEEESTFWLRF